jgi:hypothetical protein
VDFDSASAVVMHILAMGNSVVSADVGFTNGTTASGVAKEATFPRGQWPRLVLQKLSAAPGEAATVAIDFGRVESVVVALRDGTSRLFR